LQALLSQFPQIEDLSVTGAGLEEAFLQLNHQITGGSDTKEASNENA
jgi:hypothetical protein